MESVNLVTGFLTGGLTYVAAFVIVVGLIVFVHEFGHFQVGRWCGARVEAFSIGFGRAIAQWTDRKGTVWKIGWLPLGGYVKFWGDENAISMSRQERLQHIAEDPSAKACFHFKPLWQRALIVAAGPLVNFLFAIVIFAGVFMVSGFNWFEPRIVSVVEGRPAQIAGLQAGDLVTAINGDRVTEFRQIQLAALFSGGAPLHVDVDRAGDALALTINPEWSTEGSIGRYMIGVAVPNDPAQMQTTYLGPTDAISRGAGEVVTIVRGTLSFIGGLFAGREDPRQISGPVGIAEKAGQAMKLGFLELVILMAVVSVSIGLLNLFPIPMLDGGHLLFYAYEAVFGRPLNERAQEYGLRIGVALMLSLMLFATWNDLTRILGS